MEQQLDSFSIKRFELMIDMATKKFQQEISQLKETACSQAGEINSLKSQITRMQFQQPAHETQRTLFSSQEAAASQQVAQPKKEIKIVDCRPDNEKKTEFVSGSAKNSEPVRPRYGDYKPEDVSIDKFFYFGRK